MIFEMLKKDGGDLFEFVANKDNQEVVYASITAPAVVRCEIYLNGELVDIVFAGAGGSHSWWPVSPLVSPLQKGHKVKVSVNGPCAFRFEVSPGANR